MCPTSLFAQLIGTVDEEDAVLHDDTHQGQQTDLGKETHLLPGRPHGKKRPRKGQRRGQHDQQGLSKAIELAGEHYVERDQSEDKGGYDCRRRVAQSARHALFLDGFGQSAHAQATGVFRAEILVDDDDGKIKFHSVLLGGEYLPGSELARIVADLDNVGSVK